MTRHYRLVLIAALASAGLVACNGNRANVMAAQTPDEFLVVARSPLVVPPDYALRPPMPGEPRPQELNPEATARTALIGQRSAIAAAGSEGERLLMVKAKADLADPRIKEVIDDEQGDLARKPSGFANMVMFWRKDQPQTQVYREPPAPLDPEVEARRLQGLTGGQAVTIAKAPPEQERRGFKLPGL